MENKNAVNWTPTNGEKVWVKVFSNWSSGTYIGFDTINNVHVAREDDAGGGYMLVSKDILPFTSNPNTKQTAVQKNNMTAVNWLVEKLNQCEPWYSGTNVPVDYINQLIEQAREMEKKQIKDAIIHNQNGLLRRKTVLEAEEYYNETYNK